VDIERVGLERGHRWLCSQVQTRTKPMHDIADFRRNPRAAGLGVSGSVQVRYGKSQRGGPPKRRTVLTVPEMDWASGLLTCSPRMSGRCRARAATRSCS
jgi:hypothetical protein